jgi:hypothetical protein
LGIALDHPLGVRIRPQAAHFTNSGTSPFATAGLSDHLAGRWLFLQEISSQRLFWFAGILDPRLRDQPMNSEMMARCGRSVVKLRLLLL